MSFRPFNPFVPPPPDRPRNSRVDSNGRPIDPQKEQRPSVMRFLLHPELGSGLSELRDTHGLFLRLVCNIFLQTGVIDAAYPGIADPRKLSLIGLLSYAASNLQFTREGMPRVLMFGAFIASLIAVVLSMLLFTVHLLGGTN
jgi:hypothetical protein